MNDNRLILALGAVLLLALYIARNSPRAKAAHARDVRVDAARIAAVAAADVEQRDGHAFSFRCTTCGFKRLLTGLTWPQYVEARTDPRPVCGSCTSTLAQLDPEVTR